MTASLTVRGGSWPHDSALGPIRLDRPVPQAIVDTIVSAMTRGDITPRVVRSATLVGETGAVEFELYQLSDRGGVVMHGDELVVWTVRVEAEQ